jgi:fumarate reductase flavoprotein subunit
MRKLFVLGLTVLLVLVTFFGCSTNPKFTPGTYTVTSKGIFGLPLVVRVTVDGTTILAIDVEQQETKGAGDYAIQQLKDTILASQSLKVDSISGATASSRIFLNAVSEALEKAGANIAALQKRPSNQYPVYKDQTVDVVVVGSGAAGMTAAIELKEGGKNVILIEKLGILGGNTLFASTNISGVASNWQKSQGSNATEDDYYNRLITNPEVDPGAARIVADNSKYLIDRVIKGGGDINKVNTPFDVINSQGGAPGLEVVAGLKAEMDRLGVDYRLQNKAVDLLVSNGAVSGVVVETPAGNYNIHAKYVFLATGGFAWNREMVRRYGPEWESLGSTNSIGLTGDGINMAVKAGAAISSMDEFKINPTGYNTGGVNLLSFTALRANGGAIMVNKLGRRFTSETISSYTVMAKALLEQPDKIVYLVFDQSSLDTVQLISYYDDLGYYQSGNTPEELAAKIGIDPAGFAATIAKYKADAANGVDSEFGRNNMICKFTKPRYYAAKIEVAMHGTYGGISINYNAQAVKADGTVIPGLYAAGSTADMKMHTANANVCNPAARAYQGAHHILSQL